MGSGSAQPGRGQEPLGQLQAAAPRVVTGFSEKQVEQLGQAAEQTERWAETLLGDAGFRSADQALTTARALVEAKSRIDVTLEATLALRTQFAGGPHNDQQRQRARWFLRTTARLIDLSGRMRYLLHDALNNAADRLAADGPRLRELLDQLIEKRVSIGAVALSFMLLDPPPDSGLQPYSVEDKYKVLQLIALTHQRELLPVLAEFVRTEKHAGLIVVGAEVIRRVGLPQKPRMPVGSGQSPKPQDGSGQSPNLPDEAALPAPAILAEELLEIVRRVDRAQLYPALEKHRQGLLAWLQERVQRGVVGDSFRVGDMDVQPGDWLLMRNPSPYNMFTDLAPGLFTHVGVVAAETGADGIRRFVIVDLPERGARIPATPVDAFVQRTPHFVFLRHESPEVAAKLGQAALEMIGNESLFDLSFRTDRVTALKSRPLKGAVIHTYCAGLLLLCAQQTDLPREEFFPLPEADPGDNTLKNLGILGMTIGRDFVSPTGALFAPRLKIIGRREPMYEPGREIQEAVFDHFAERMIHGTLTPAPTAVQTLVEKLAGLSKTQPWLAHALARANNVHERMDLEAAAKAAAVIDTMDDIATESVREFHTARQAIMAEPAAPGDAAKPRGTEHAARLETYRQRHADLARRWQAGAFNARQLRVALVRFYADRGRGQLDQRFFNQNDAAKP